MNITVLGCGRWGSFHAWYAHRIGHNVGSLTLAIKEKRCEASKMAYFFVNFSIFFLSNV